MTKEAFFSKSGWQFKLKKIKMYLNSKNKIVRLDKQKSPKIPYWIYLYRVNRFNVVSVNRFRTNPNRFTIMLMNWFSTKLNRFSMVRMNRFITEMNRFNQSVIMFSWQTTYMHYSLHISQLGDKLIIENTLKTNFCIKTSLTLVKLILKQEKPKILLDRKSVV